MTNRIVSKREIKREALTTVDSVMFVDNEEARKRLNDLVDHGYTITSLSRILGINYMTLHAIYSGRTKKSRAKFVEAILTTELPTVSTTKIRVVSDRCHQHNEHTTAKNIVRHLIKKEGYTAEDLAERFHTSKWVILNAFETAPRHLPWEVERVILETDFEFFEPPRDVKPKVQHVFFGNEYTTDTE